MMIYTTRGSKLLTLQSYMTKQKQRMSLFYQMNNNLLKYLILFQCAICGVVGCEIRAALPEQSPHNSRARILLMLVRRRKAHTDALVGNESHQPGLHNIRFHQHKCDGLILSSSPSPPLPKDTNLIRDRTSHVLRSRSSVLR